MKFLQKIILSVFVLSSTCIYAWNTTGHMVVSQIAYDSLTTPAKIAVDSLAQAMADENFYDNYRHKVSNYQDYLDIAHWPDDLKLQYDTFSSPWHFQNNAWTDDQTPIAAPMATLPYNSNVVWAVGEAANVLSKPVKKISNEDTVNLRVRARSLSYLIHFVGDAHQPLHCSTRVTKDFPNGDVGGNDFVIDPALRTYQDNMTFAYPISELHALWDDALMLYPMDFGLDPSFTASKEAISGAGGIAMTIEKDYPLNHFSIAQTCLSRKNYKTLAAWAQDWANTWCQESLAIAKTIYPPTSVISEDYLKNNTPIAEQRLALAGYRLSVILNTLFDSGYKSPCD